MRCIALVCTLRYDIVIIDPNSRDTIHAASTYNAGRLLYVPAYLPGKML